MEPNARPVRIAGVAALVTAALLPYLSSVVTFAQQGITNPVLSGDAAVLELGVRRAAHFAQFARPDAGLVWNQPGPLYFYLVAPFYLLFHERSSALNLFALIAGAASVAATVLVARRLRGWPFAFAIAALLALFERVAVPYVIANEWSQVVPILPLICLAILTAFTVSSGRLVGAFWAVVIGLAIVQAHAGFAPGVAALAGLAVVAAGLSASRTGLRYGVIVLLAIGWSVPLYQAIAASRENVRQRITSAAPANAQEPAADMTARTALEQSVVMPQAILRVVSRREVPMPPAALDAFGVIQLACLAWLAFRGRQIGDRGLFALSVTALVLFASALIALAGIKSESPRFFTSWMAVGGCMAWVPVTAWIVGPDVRVLGGRKPRLLVAASLAVLLLAVAPPFWTVAPIPESDAETALLGAGIASYLRAADLQTPPTLEIAAHSLWPTAAGVVLYLEKRGVPVRADPELLPLVGSAFAPPDAAGVRLRIVRGADVNTVPGGSTLVASGLETQAYRREP